MDQLKRFQVYWAIVKIIMNRQISEDREYLDQLNKYQLLKEENIILGCYLISKTYLSHPTLSNCFSIPSPCILFIFEVFRHCCTIPASGTSI